MLIYFARDTPGDYGTYVALVAAHTVKHGFLTILETCLIAQNKRKSGTAVISTAIAAGIKDIKAWPYSYFKERATHVEVEIETKYSGGGGITGAPGQKHPTGWYTVHDSAKDLAVGTFDGERFYHLFPNTVRMVTDRYHNLQVAKKSIPDALSK